MSILTVVTPATKFDLTILATVKEELGIPTLTTTYDAQLARLIHEASAYCATYCGRVFASEVVTETLRNVWSTVVSLQRFPVTAFTSITEDGTALVVTTDYEVDAETGWLYRVSGDERTDWSASKLVITYTGGYALLDGLPRPLERAAIDLVKLMFFSSNRDPALRSVDVPGVMSETFWVGSIGDGPLPPHIEGPLKSFRRINV